MACSRRGLAYTFTRHLHHRLRPSFAAHLLHDDHDPSSSSSTSSPAAAVEPPGRRRPSPLPSFPAFARSFPAIGGSRSALGHRLAFGVEPFLRSYSSSTTGGSNEINYINDVAEVLPDDGIEAAASTAAIAASIPPAPIPGEVAAAAADSYLPVALLQHLIDNVHSFTGLNWWASIALTTILIRVVTVPLLINQMKATYKLNNMRPEMEELQQQLKNSMDPQFMQEGQKRMKALFKKHGVTPFTPLKGILIQGPLFISFFMAISNMVEKVPSFKGGGAYWFTDLTIPDPLYVLPVLTALTFLAMVELNMQEGMEGNPMANTMKNFSRVLGVLTVPLTASFPRAIFCYWITSNIFSLIYGFVIKRPSVKKFLNIPNVVPQANPSPQPNFSFFEAFKPVAPAASPLSSKEAEQPKPSERRISSSTVTSQRIRNLEKIVKGRSKPKKR